MAVLEALLAIVLGAMALAILLPFRVEADAAIHDLSARGSLRLEWAWGVLGLRLAPGSRAELRLAGLRVWRFSGSATGERKASEEERSALQRTLSALRNRRPLLAMARRFARALRLRLRVAGVLGTGDPADTALLYSLSRLLQSPHVELDVEWDWLDDELELEAEGSARIWLAHLLPLAAGLMLSRENRVALRAMG